MDILILSAANFERKSTELMLQARGTRFAALDVGAGALAAAKNAKTLGENARGKDVLFIGTCGSFYPFAEPHLVKATKVLWKPSGERAEIAYGLDQFTPEISLTKTASEFLDLPDRKVICGPSISLTNTLPKDFSESVSGLVENLELYSIAAEVSENAKSFSVILCVTNTLGQDAHVQWKKNHKAADVMTAQFIQSSLR